MKNVDKERDHFELLIESKTNLKIWYKDKDQFGDLLISKDLRDHL